MQGVDREVVEAFRRHAMLRQQLASSTLTDTISKLRHMARREQYGELAVDFGAGEQEFEDEVERWLFHRLNQGMSKTAANNYIKAVNRWSRFRGYDVHFDLYPEQTPETFTPTPDQVKKCIDVCKGRNPIDKRNKCMIVTLAATGLRNEELVNLEISDVDFDRCTVTVRHGKGGKSRVVHPEPKVVSGENYPSIRNYVEYHRIESHPTALWTTRPNEGAEGGEMTKDYCRKLVKEIGRKAGVPRIHPHAFRRYFAVTLVRSGVPMPVIQRELGHENLGTTDKYLRGITDYDVTRALRAANVPDPMSASIHYRSMNQKNRGVLVNPIRVKPDGPGGI